MTGVELGGQTPYSFDDRSIQQMKTTKGQHIRLINKDPLLDGGNTQIIKVDSSFKRWCNEFFYKDKYTYADKTALQQILKSISESPHPTSQQIAVGKVALRELAIDSKLLTPAEKVEYLHNLVKLHPEYATILKDQTQTFGNQYIAAQFDHLKDLGIEKGDLSPFITLLTKEIVKGNTVDIEKFQLSNEGVLSLVWDKLFAGREFSDVLVRNIVNQLQSSSLSYSQKFEDLKNLGVNLKKFTVDPKACIPLIVDKLEIRESIKPIVQQLAFEIVRDHVLSEALISAALVNPDEENEIPKEIPDLSNLGTYIKRECQKLNISYQAALTSPGIFSDQFISSLGRNADKNPIKINQELKNIEKSLQLKTLTEDHTNLLLMLMERIGNDEFRAAVAKQANARWKLNLQ